MTYTTTTQWLVLLHQLPAKPPYQRVKIWRRLQAIGAVPLKNAAHVLPRSDEAAALFAALVEEIVSGGGEAILIGAELLGGQSDADVRALFDAVRDADYGEIADAARRLLETGPAGGPDIARLHKRMAEAASLDFFGAPGRRQAEAAITELDRRRHAHPDVGRVAPAQTVEPADLIGRTWVTRRGVHVDRIACAWLIRRFIDPGAAFRFVDGGTHAPAPGELRFDMADAEFTHEGDRCSFETLLLRAGLDGDAGLAALGEVIHELDIADGRFARPETAGIGAMLAGVCASTQDDLERIAQAGQALDQFHAFFSCRKGER